MDTELKPLPVVLIALAMAGIGGYLVFKNVKRPAKYSVPSYVWGCDENCQCDELHLTDMRYIDGHWEYWMGYPENVWIGESLIDNFVANGLDCMSGK